MSVSGPDILASKVSVPSELRTKELAILPAWIRERAFFMASVDRAEVLDAFRDKVASMAGGELSLQQARKLLREDLGQLDYKPLPGQEGTIKDLTSERRMNVALQTNLLQVNGYARWTRQQGALDSFPAQRFSRHRMSVKPRENWPERFATAVGGQTDGADIESMSALVNHPCWIRLSVFGSPYPPFDFNSGMGLDMMDRDEAEALGLLPGEDADPEHADMMEPQDRGLNETLEASPAVRSQVIRAALADELQGFAKWDKDRIVFTDPNGTRPYTAAELADVWKQPLPKAFSELPGEGQMQKASYIEWAQDHARYENDPEKNKYPGGKDYWADFHRVVSRLKPSGREAGELFRGISFNSSRDLGSFLSGIERQGYGVRAEFPAESWTGSLAAARKYATQGDYRVLLRLPGGHSAARDVAPLTRAFAKEITGGESPQGKLAVTDDEILVPKPAKIRVKAIRRVQETGPGKTVEVILEEAR